MRSWLFVSLLACSVMLFLLASAQAAQDTSRADIRVELGSANAQASKGRLLVFAISANDAEAAALEASGGTSSVVRAVDANPFRASQTTVVAREVTRWEPKQSVTLTQDDVAFPAALSALVPGNYYLQAVLDVDHSYNYNGRGAGDLVSEVLKVQLPLAAAPVLTLSQVLPAHDPWQLPDGAPASQREALQTARAHAQAVDFRSPALSDFWGRPVSIQAWVLTPPNYDAKATAHYPTVYFTHGFGGDMNGLIQPMLGVYSAMEDGQMPPMVWVFLDQSSATGTHEFADSVNNGPWGHSLTSEFIPHLESQFRMDAKPNGRFLQGHSSGGWATLWLQTRYPKMFGGTWSTSPDPSDFHDFTGVDLYGAHRNAYRRPDGSAYPLVRDHGKVLGTYEQFAKLERALGAYGGQMASFDWVFSPRGADGAPMPMFDRDTGVIDANVVAYWREHYDIAYLVQKNWSQLKADLDGKVHVAVGTADTFYLDGAVGRLKAVFDGLGAKTDFQFLPDRSHFDVYAIGDDHNALLKRITWEMYAVARPQSTLKPAKRSKISD